MSSWFFLSFFEYSVKVLNSRSWTRRCDIGQANEVRHRHGWVTIRKSQAGRPAIPVLGAQLVLEEWKKQQRCHAKRRLGFPKSWAAACGVPALPTATQSPYTKPHLTPLPTLLSTSPETRFCTRQRCSSGDGIGPHSPQPQPIRRIQNL